MILLIKKIGLYNAIAPYYDYLDSFYENLVYRNMRAKYISQITDSRILEVGIGTGKNLKYYNLNNKEIIGIDISIKMLQEAKKRLVDSSRELRNLVQLKQVQSIRDLEKNSFDYVVATFVLCTNDEPKEIIDEILTVLKPGGKVLLFEWIPEFTGSRAIALHFIHPFLHFFFGVSVYRKNSLRSFSKNNWKFLKVESFGTENKAVLIQKKNI